MGTTPQEALDLFNSDDLIGIGMAANEVRRAKTDPRMATYQIDRNINYTNFCTEYCSFCAFYRPLGAKDGYILPLETIYEKIEEMLELGGTGVLMQGGLHPDLRIEFYENMLRSLKTEISAGAPALLFGAGDYLHRGSFRAFGARHDCALARCGARFHSRRRRGNSRRRSSRAHFAVEVQVGRMGRHASHSARAGDAHHRDDDVRLRRRISPSRESSGDACAASRKIPADSPRSFPGFSRRKIRRWGRKFRRLPRSIT